jgi:hypothetical protein
VRPTAGLNSRPVDGVRQDGSSRRAASKLTGWLAAA